MRQVQIAAGFLVLLGLLLSQTVAPAWILLSELRGRRGPPDPDRGSARVLA